MHAIIIGNRNYTVTTAELKKLQSKKVAYAFKL